MRRRSAARSWRSACPRWVAPGVLAHVSSLPGDYGIGNLGPGARSFVDFLARAGVRHWQICPIGPTGYGDSPYQLFSGRAGNPYFIDLGELAAVGLIQPAELAPLCALAADRVNYGGLYASFWTVLAQAYDRFAASGASGLPGLGPLSNFRQAQAGWLQPLVGCDEMLAARTFPNGPENSNAQCF